jgi:hypothetical protein
MRAGAPGFGPALLVTRADRNPKALVEGEVRTHGDLTAGW